MMMIGSTLIFSALWLIEKFRLDATIDYTMGEIGLVQLTQDSFGETICPHYVSRNGYGARTVYSRVGGGHEYTYIPLSCVNDDSDEEEEEEEEEEQEDLKRRRLE